MQLQLRDLQNTVYLKMFSIRLLHKKEDRLIVVLPDAAVVAAAAVVAVVDVEVVVVEDVVVAEVVKLIPQQTIQFSLIQIKGGQIMVRTIFNSNKLIRRF